MGALVAVALAAAGLGACDRPDEFEGSLTDRAAATTSSGTIRMVERDVEAPEIFQAEEPGLWDGRPSLGGVWVAHPDVGEPERVLIRNEATGAFVIGALFRRERENPGPRLQVSSDAASALGILPGAPTGLTVTALRRQEAPEPSAPAAPASETRTAQADAPATQAPPRSAPGAAAVATAPVATQPLPPTDAAPTQVAQSQPARTAPTPPQPTSPAQPPAEAVVALAPTPPAEPRMSARALAELTATAEEAIARSAPSTAPAPQAAPDSAPVRTVSAPAASAAAAAPVAASPHASSLDRPLVQIGIFSVQDNATGTARRMQSAGLRVNVLEEQSHGKTFWRVTLGPATNADEHRRLLARAREMGFADAYAVRR